MAITRTAMIDDDGSGTTGTILNNAWKQELYGQIDAADRGIWTPEPFNAANYYASSGNWTVTAGNQQVLQWATLAGAHIVVVSFLITGTMTLTGSPVSLGIILSAPPFTANAANSLAYFLPTGSGGATGYVELEGPGTRLRFLRDITGNPFLPGTGQFFFLGQIIYSY